jgi:hypothetical protein
MERRIIEGIESCRPGSDDLQSPELADVAQCVEFGSQAREVYQRAQKWDTSVSQAMEQVEVPAGLAERILAALGQQPAPSASLAHAVDNAQRVEADPNATVAPRPAEAPWSRRQWLAAASVIAATLLVAVFAGQYFRTDDELAPDEMVDAWLADLSPRWNEMHDVPPDFVLPVSLTTEPSGWQSFRGANGVRGVAFKLVRANVGNALLLVVRLSRPTAPTSPPSRPQSTTGGKSIGYWRSGQLLYVLVVEGTEREYRTYVNAAGSPVA